MSDEDQAELWQQIDADFQSVVQADKKVAAHAHVGRDELERHVRVDHGVIAHSTVRDAGARVDIVELSDETEAKLRVSHWRLHELGVEHRFMEGQQ